MTLTRILTLVFAIQCCTLSLAVSQVPSEGLKLAADGSLAWVDHIPKNCDQCKRSGEQKCFWCEEDGDEDCIACSGSRKIRCVSCLGTCKTLDSFSAILCTFCEGHGSVYLDKAKTMCGLCKGAGCLPMTKVDGKDPRLAGLGALLRSLRALQSARIQLADFKHPPKGAIETAKEAVLAVTRQLLERLSIPKDRAKIVFDELKPEDSTLEGLRSHFYDKKRQLLELSAVYIENLRNCIWRIEYNKRLVSNATVISYPASEFRWSSWFGSTRKFPADTFTMLGRGFFRVETSPDTEETIQKWMSDHPKAVVIPVCSTSPVLRGNPEARLVFCWLVDGEDNLNLHLVEQGCVPAGCFHATVSQIDVSVPEYREFLDRLKKANDSARENQRGIWKDSEKLKEFKEREADRLMKAREFGKALKLLTEIVDMGRAGRYEWLDIAKCHGELGQYAKAIAAYDKAIGNGGWWQPYSDKARFISKQKGVRVAVAWLESLRPSNQDSRKVDYLLGMFHMEARRLGKAIQHFKRVVKLQSEKHEFAFGKDHKLILDKKTLARENNDFASMSSELEYLADCCYRVGNSNEALRFAIMGISIDQQILRCKGYYEPKEIEVGSISCRLICAHVFMDRGALETAQLEIDQAHILAERGSYTGHKRAVKSARTKLEKLRSK